MFYVIGVAVFVVVGFVVVLFVIVVILIGAVVVCRCHRCKMACFPGNGHVW